MQTTIEKPTVGSARSAPAKSPNAASGVKKLSLGGITKKKEDAKTAYPVFDTDPEAQLIAARIIERDNQLKAIEGALEVDKADLRQRCAPFYFTQGHGKHDVPSSISVPSAQGEVLVTFQKRYSKLADETPLLPILGERTGEFFRQKLEVKIDGDKLPQDTAQQLLEELQELFAKFNASEALSALESLKPTDEFHAARHLLLTPSQNLELEQVCPIVAVVKQSRGRK